MNESEVSVGFRGQLQLTYEIHQKKLLTMRFVCVWGGEHLGTNLQPLIGCERSDITQVGVQPENGHRFNQYDIKTCLHDRFHIYLRKQTEGLMRSKQEEGG